MSRKINRRRRYLRQKKQTPLFLRPIVLLGNTLIVIVLSLFLAGTASAVGVYLYFAKDLTPPENIAIREIARSTKIYDRNGVLLNEIFDPRGGRRTTVKIDDVPQYLKWATIATEDADFYSNSGINVRGLARAAYRNFQGEIEGGSSITVQLVKNVLIPEEERMERSPARKIKEAILAFELTRRYPKDQILEWYLNEINYGNLSYGIESAAEGYFGKSARDLTLAESAMLVGLPQAPAWYSPLDNPERAKRRQSDVLDLMVKQDYITEAQAEAAKKEPLQYARREFPIKAPHFVMYVRGLLEKRYGADALYRGGLQVTTSLDLGLQEEAETIARDHLDKLAAVNAHNAAIVALRPQTGEILTMLGSVDFFNRQIDGQVNMATAERQPGSSFKPITYLTSFMKGYSPATMLLDVRTVFPDGINQPYVPENVDNKFHGPVSIRIALANSLNIPAVKAISFTGVRDVLDMAHRLGITSLTRENTYGLSLTLGGGEVKPLDLVYAYTVFANGGTMAGSPVSALDRRPGMREVEPVAILKIVDARGEVLDEFKTPQTKPIISPQLAYQITNILSDNEARAVFFGHNNPLRLPDRPAAAKTGTTNDWRDAWTVGYTPELAAGIWVGNSDNKAMVRGFGSTVAAPIWHDFMVAALKDMPPSEFKEPGGLEKVKVCSVSGKIPNKYCPETRTEIFVQGTAPKDSCDIHQLVRIDKTTGKLATNQTPPQDIEEKVFEILPPEAADWARDAEIPVPPTDYSPATVTSDLAIASPLASSYQAGIVDITGSAVITEQQFYLLEYGIGPTPNLWTQIGRPHTEKVAGGKLEQWNTKGLDGLVTLRLRAVGKNNTEREVRVPVTIDNTAPTVRISTLVTGTVLRLVPGQTETVSLQAEVADTIGIARVEFFIDDKSLGFTAVSPYSMVWRLQRGSHQVKVVAYDRAGNSTTAGPLEIRVQ